MYFRKLVISGRVETRDAGVRKLGRRTDGEGLLIEKLAPFLSEPNSGKHVSLDVLGQGSESCGLVHTTKSYKHIGLAFVGLFVQVS